jgi:choline dehydrogenase
MIHPTNSEIASLIPKDFQQRGSCDLEADYIIIGAGTAGCVVARRLSDDYDNSVLVFEAGENNDADKRICCESGQTQPAFASTIANFFNQFFWPGTTVPQVNNVNDLALQFTGGRLFGGTSSANGEIYYRGSAALYNDWVAALGGDQSWSPENVGNIIKQFENYNGTSQAPQTRGYGGPLNVRQTQAGASEELMQGVFLAVAAGTSAQPVDDYNTEPLVGPAIDVHKTWQVTEFPDGRRASSSVSFLPASVINRIGEGPNSKVAVGQDGRKLLIVFKTTVMRIIFDESVTPPRAIGVEWLRSGEVLRRAFARRRVIVSAGIHSASLLQLSGVGPRDVLEPANVRVIAENPNVGIGLQDQPLVYPLFLSPPGFKPTDFTVGYVAGAGLPDPRLLLPNPPLGLDPNRRAVEFYGQSAPGPDGPTNIFILITEHLRPTSRGSIKIISNDPLKPVLPDYGWLTQEDFDILKAIIQVYVQRFQNEVVKLGFIPLTFQDFSDATVEAYIKSSVVTSYHYASSVKMATLANGGAADGMGRVYGTQRLHVVDNSLQPLCADGNPSLEAYLIGAKISADILALDATEKPIKFKVSNKC